MINEAFNEDKSYLFPVPTYSPTYLVACPHARV